MSALNWIQVIAILIGIGAIGTVLTVFVYWALGLSDEGEGQ